MSFHEKKKRYDLKYVFIIIISISANELSNLMYKILRYLENNNAYLIRKEHVQMKNK